MPCTPHAWEGDMNDDIETLRHTREDKFDEICSTIAFAYGAAPDPKNIYDVRKVDQIIKAAEKMLKRTTVRGNWDRETKTKLQRLVTEHNELSKRISREIKVAREELTKRGVLVDSGKRDPQRGEIMWTFNPTIREELVKRGAWVDSGKRDPQTGEIIWTPNPNLTEEQLEALIKDLSERVRAA